MGNSQIKNDGDGDQSSIILKQQLIQQFNLIWVDGNINNSENKRYQDRFKQVFKNCFYFQSLDQYSNHFQQLKQNNPGQYFIIVSGSLGKELVDEAQHQQLVDSVFIFCKNVEYHLTWARNYTKIKCVRDKIQDIIDILLDFVCVKNYLSQSYKSAFHFTNEDQYIQHIYLDFLYQLLYKETQQKNKAIDEFNQFSIEYIENSILKTKQQQEKNNLKELLEELKIADEVGDDIIYWYTKESFLYGMINNTIRTGDLVKIFLIRIAICLLSQQLKNQPYKSEGYPKQLFRGTCIDQNEFHLWNKERKPFMLQGFTSTTPVKEVALKFQKRTYQQFSIKDQQNKLKVLIQINIQQNQLMNYPVSIQSISAIYNEDEYLMHLNTFLEVIQVKQLNEYILIECQLSNIDNLITNMSEITLKRKQSIDQILDKIYPIEHFYMVDLLHEIGMGKQMIEILDLLEDLEKLQECYKLSFYGQSYQLQRDFKASIRYFMKALDIQLQEFGEEDIKVSISYSNIGQVYQINKDYDKALEYFKKSFDIKKKILGEDHEQIASLYNNIGQTMDNLGNFEKALECYQRSLNIKIAHHGQFHSSIAITYANIGSVYTNLEQFDEALEYYNKSLDIKTQCFGQKHVSTATTYNDIASVYYFMEDYQKSLEYYEKSLLILGHGEPQRATIKSNYERVQELVQKEKEKTAILQSQLQIPTNNSRKSETLYRNTARKSQY